MDPFAVGAILQGVGSLSGFFGKGSRGPSLSDQYKAAYQYQKRVGRNQASWAVEGAKAAGLHPLFAMGYQGAASMPAISTGGDLSGDGLSGAFAGIGNAVSDFARADMERRAMDTGAKQAAELHQAQVAELEASALERMSRARLNEKEAGAIGQAAAASALGRAGQVSNSQQDVQKVDLGAAGSFNLAPGITDAQTLSDKRGDAAELLLVPQLLKEVLQSADEWLSRSVKKHMTRGERNARDYYWKKYTDSIPRRRRQDMMKGEIRR